MSEQSLPPIPYTMQEKSMEVLNLEARNEILTKNIDKLETENAKLKSEILISQEEYEKFTEKIEDIEKDNNKLRLDLLSLEETHENLLDEFNEIKLQKKGRDDKVLELEKEVESQKSDLARAYDEIKTQKENEQSKNTLAECPSKPCMEVRELESIIKNLETQITNYKTQLDKMEKKCETLRHHNEILSCNGINKAQINDEGQSYDNCTNEKFSEDKRDEPLIESEEKQGPEQSMASLQSIQDSDDEMMGEHSDFGELSLNEERLPEIEKEEEIEIEIENSNPRIFLDISDSCRNLSLNSQFSCYEKIGNAVSEEQKSMVEALRSAIHNFVCRWIDVEINFIHVLLVFIVEAIVLIRAFLVRLVRQSQYPKWKVSDFLDLSSCGLSLFFTSSLWIYSQLIKNLFKTHILRNGIDNYFSGQKFQYNYELIDSDEPASDQGIPQLSRHSSIYSMSEEEIKKLNSPLHHSSKKSDLDSSSNLGKPLSSTNSSTYDSKTYKISRLPGLERSNSELAPSSDLLEGELSLAEFLLRIISLLFFAPVRTGMINKRGTRSVNSNLSLRPICKSSSRQYLFSNLSKLVKIFSKISAEGICGKPLIWLTMIEIFTHFYIYTVIYIVWLKVLQSSLPHSSYYEATYGYDHLHGWAHQLHFSEQWASKLERFTFNMITLFGVQVKSFPLPG